VRGYFTTFCQLLRPYTIGFGLWQHCELEGTENEAVRSGCVRHVGTKHRSGWKVEMTCFRLLFPPSRLSFVCLYFYSSLQTHIQTLVEGVCVYVCMCVYV
jgi:hypothetical protein